MIDLGELDGPVLVFGGPYSNLEAARAIRAEAVRLGIPPARTICTGDVVAYCADPGATVALIRDWGIPVVMGNVEEALDAGAADCGCNFTPGSACERLAAAWYAHAEREISADDRRWMAGLPRLVRFGLAGRRLAAIHGAVSHISRWIFASSPAAEKLAEIALAGGVDGVVAGHCGLPFAGVVGGRLWCNAGTVGMPANDATPRVWHALLTPGPRSISVELRPLDYDHRRAAQKIRRARLAEAYARTLESGLWPPVDVLPPRERAAAKRPLAAARDDWMLAEPGLAA